MTLPPHLSHLYMNIDNQVYIPTKIARLYDDLSVQLKFKNFKVMEIPTAFPPSEVPQVLYLVHSIEHRNMSLFFQSLNDVTIHQQTAHHGWYPLHFCAEFGFYTAAKKLLDVGASPLSQSDEGALPLHLAARRGNVKIVELLLQAAPSSVNHQDSRGESSLFLLTQRWSKETGPRSAFKCLYYAACALLLLKANAQIDLRNFKDQMNVIHLASQSGRSDIVSFYLNRTPKSELLNLVNSTDREGDTPLILNCYKAQSIQLARLLIKKGADVEARNVRQQTALDVISTSASRRAKQVRCILEAGSSLSSLNDSDQLSPPYSPNVSSPEIKRKLYSPMFESPFSSPKRDGPPLSPLHSPPVSNCKRSAGLFISKRKDE
ncbi:hypothetical protein P9112_004435 [Eukaryota sp. TZLM1-RC]